MASNFSVEIAGIRLEHVLMNAGGTCKLLEGADGVKEFARSNTAAVMVGSVTIDKREAGEGETYWTGGQFSLNSRGLDSPGMLYYQKCLSEMVAIVHEAGKPLFINVVGFNPTEYAILTEFAFGKGVDFVELGLSCPNVWRAGQQRPIACFEPELVGEILERVRRRVGVNERISVKVSPYSDPFLLRKVAKVIKESGIVKAVTTMNTFPNALLYDEEGKPRINSSDGLAGLGGPAIKPIGLGQVKQWRNILPPEISIIGVGGITTAQDIFDYQHAGAAVFQVATAFFERGQKVFEDLLAELIEHQS